jgi:RNA polymerase sigma-70 factor, ECF subfamily
MSYLRSRPDLLRRFRCGEREALAEVYRAYLPEVTAVLRRGFVVRSNGLRIPGCTNRHDLADVLQEVFIRTFKCKAREAYDGQRDYGAYLATVARNVVIDRYRKGAREQFGIDPDLLCDAELTAPELAPDDAPWIDGRSLEIARRYVADLEGPLRDVHSARYVAALSQRDAARELGFSRPKVRKLEQRLRRELLRLLREAGLRADQTAEPVVARSTKEAWTRRPRTS